MVVCRSLAQYTSHPHTPHHTIPQTGAPGTEGASVSPKAREGSRTGTSWSGSQGTRGGKQEARNGRTKEEASPREARSPQEDSCWGTCVRRCHCGGVCFWSQCVCTLHVFLYEHHPPLVATNSPSPAPHPPLVATNSPSPAPHPPLVATNSPSPAPTPGLFTLPHSCTSPLTHVLLPIHTLSLVFSPHSLHVPTNRT